jgi:transcriptional regulator with XRE-family HTH domain
LRTLRKGKRLTMETAAQQAGVHRATLQRWESGEVQPRLSELTSLLTTLDVTEIQKHRAVSLMEAPRALRQIRREVMQVAEQREMPPLPHGGDLLHALRMRRRLSLEEIAARVQVTARTLRRWEKMEVWPSVEQLHRLCYALGAHEEEVVTLTVGRFSQKPALGKTSVEALQERLDHLRMLEEQPGGYPLFELEYLQMEADAWPLAMRSAAGKQMLIAVSAYHAQCLSFRERLTEAGTIANQALDLMGEKLKPDMSWIYPVMVSARASVYRGEHPAPKRGIERLRPWLAMAQWPEMRAWMLADMAKYLSQSGEPEAALPLVEQACQVAETSGRSVEWTLRRWDKAALLLQASRPVGALAIVEERTEMEDESPSNRIDVSLLRAEAYLGVGELSEAHDWLQHALTDIDTYHIEYKRPHAERVAAKL